MTEELLQIKNEIEDISSSKADIDFLEALVNNAVYCLSSHQKKINDVEIKKRIDLVITDILNTLNKEIEWAKEELEKENYSELNELFSKAKNQILSDLNQLF